MNVFCKVVRMWRLTKEEFWLECLSTGKDPHLGPETRDSGQLSRSNSKNRNNAEGCRSLQTVLELYGLRYHERRGCGKAYFSSDFKRINRQSVSLKRSVFLSLFHLLGSCSFLFCLERGRNCREAYRMNPLGEVIII